MAAASVLVPSAVEQKFATALGFYDFMGSGSVTLEDGLNAVAGAYVLGAGVSQTAPSVEQGAWRGIVEEGAGRSVCFGHAGLPAHGGPMRVRVA